MLHTPGRRPEAILELHDADAVLDIERWLRLACVEQPMLLKDIARVWEEDRPSLATLQLPEEREEEVDPATARLRGSRDLGPIARVVDSDKERVKFRLSLARRCWRGQGLAE